MATVDVDEIEDDKPPVGEEEKNSSSEPVAESRPSADVPTNFANIFSKDGNNDDVEEAEEATEIVEPEDKNEIVETEHR